MRLRELEAHWIGEWTPTTHRYLDNVEGAQGVQFLCPLCFKENGGPVGTHSVLCYFLNPRRAPRVPDDAEPGPGRWTFEGDTLDTLTFVGPGAASVLLQSPLGCGWHGFIRNGEATLS